MEYEIRRAKNADIAPALDLAWRCKAMIEISFINLTKMVECIRLKQRGLMRSTFARYKIV